MTCPNCQNVCGETDRFCFRCGAALTAEKPPKKGTHLVPILILAALSILGIALFFMIPMAETQSDTPWFAVENGILSFDEGSYHGPAELTVPSEVDGQTVRGISDHCFEDCIILTTVILPDTLESIGDAAFAGCISLRGISIPEGVTHIGAEAFLSCSALEAVTVPSTTESIGEDAFGGCGKLNYIFYNDIHSHWKDLYSTFIGPNTQVFCTDGAFLQR